MSIIDRIFSKTEKPVMKVSTTDGLTFSYATDIDVFYKAYEQNSYVEICVNRISDDVGKYGYLVKRGKFEKDIKLFSDLTKYSLKLTPKEFIKRIVRDYEVAANVYVYVARDKKGKIQGIQILDPRFMKPIASKDGQILGYMQNLEGIRFFTHEEIFHLRGDSDLTNEAVGRSKLQSLFLDLESDKEAKESNWAFFANNQTPSSIVILDKEIQDPSADMLDKIKRLFEGGANRGGKNKHRTSIIQGIKEILKIQDKIQDAEFLGLRRFTIELVCAAYDVPKDMIGLTDTSNKSVGETQSEIYWDMIEGVEKLIAEFVTNILRYVYNDDAYSFEFVQDNTRKLLKRKEIAVDLYESGLITQNEGRAIVQYETVEGGEKFAEPKASPQPDAKKLSKTA